MRGKHALERLRRLSTRITPAHAGKTRGSRPCECISEDHPRACGENLLTLLFSGGTAGSPPRMRGKHLQRVSVALRVRITPAHAGKTAAWQADQFQVEDHPRACGENEEPCQTKHRSGGSPPRMRGKPHCIASPLSDKRITPAHAGKTAHPSRRACWRWDHPRACGENTASSRQSSG